VDVPLCAGTTTADRPYGRNADRAKCILRMLLPRPVRSPCFLWRGLPEQERTDRRDSTSKIFCRFLSRPDRWPTSLSFTAKSGRRYARRVLLRLLYRAIPPISQHRTVVRAGKTPRLTLIPRSRPQKTVRYPHSSSRSVPSYDPSYSNTGRGPAVSATIPDTSSPSRRKLQTHTSPHASSCTVGKESASYHEKCRRPPALQLLYGRVAHFGSVPVAPG